MFTSDEESAMAATTEIESSAEKPVRRGRRTKTSSRGSYRRAALPDSPSPSSSKRGPYVSPTMRSSSRSRKKLAPSKINPTKCKWCKKWGGNGLAHGPPNNVPHSKCNYNEDWDGWRPHYVCRKMDMAYKERDECKA
jgi:hypothetical protein